VVAVVVGVAVGVRVGVAVDVGVAVGVPIAHSMVVIASGLASNLFRALRIRTFQIAPT